MKKVALIGEYDPAFPPHVATDAAIQHSQAALGVQVSASWLSTEDIDEGMFEAFSGIWVAPGSPYRNMAKTLWAIRFARENGVPCLGTCGGFQHIVLEYARNVLGFEDAQHAEYDPYASNLFITQLACSLVGREMQLSLLPGSRVAEIYASLTATEQYYCNFGVNPAYVSELSRGPMVIAGSDAEGEVRVLEHPNHPCYFGTLFVPQARSRPGVPHPLVTYFVKAVSQTAA